MRFRKKRRFNRFKRRRFRRVFRRSFRRTFGRFKRRFPRKTMLTDRYTFGQKAFVKLNYADTTIVPSSATNPFIYVYRTNSIFDPDLSFGGNEPMWKETLGEVYGRYRVRGYKYNIKIWNIGTGGSGMDVICAVYHRSADASITDLDLVTEPGREAAMIIRNATTKFLPSPLNAANTHPLVFKGYRSVTGIVGDRMAKNDADYEALINANPLKQTLLNIQIASNGLGAPATITTTLNIWVRFRFYVELFDRKTGTFV